MSSENGVAWGELQAPMDVAEIEWRVRKKGTSKGKPWAKIVPFPDARRLQDRLDQVLGPAGWTTDYIPGPQGGVICSLAIRVNGEWIAKEDGAENTDIESVKGGLTDAFKRACVQWNVCGIRGLYRVGDCWAQFSDDGRYDAKIDGSFYSWSPPEIKLSESGVTVNHKRNGDSGGDSNAIEEALEELRAWDADRADKARQYYDANSSGIHASAENEKAFVEQLEDRIEKAKDAAEQEVAG